MGFQPTLRNVVPWASMFAPATYGLQLPIGLLKSPQTQASTTDVPGGLT